jgi:hypothetical protein
MISIGSNSFILSLSWAKNSWKYWVITNDVSDYINVSVRIAHIIRNHPLGLQENRIINIAYFWPCLLTKIEEKTILQHYYAA